jgi:Tfp pilus assembly protein PilP
MRTLSAFAAVMWLAVASPVSAMQAATPQKPTPPPPAAPVQPKPAPPPAAAQKPAPPPATTQKPAAPAPAPAPSQKPAAPTPAPAAPGQKPAAPPPKPPAQAPAPSNPLPVENYTYDPAGRRDPFLNLLGTGSQPIVSRRGEGLAGLSVNELSVRGVMQSKGQFIGMVQGPDGKTYMARAGDKLLDGTVRAVNAEGLIIVQDVSDPLSLVRQREVSKKLRSLEAR